MGIGPHHVTPAPIMPHQSPGHLQLGMPPARHVTGSGLARPSSPGTCTQQHTYATSLPDMSLGLQSSVRANPQGALKPGQAKRTRALIEGPYGSPSIDLHGDR